MTRITRRGAAALGAGLVGVVAGARAQGTAGAVARPVRIISPFAPGGAVDVLARLIAERLSVQMGGQPVVVDARPGANGIVGTEAFVRAVPDGLTIMITTSGTVMNNPALYPSLPYDPVRDLVPVTMLSVGSVLLTAPAAAPYADMRGFLDWARGRSRVTYGSWGVGSSAHLYGELLKREHAVPLEHVPYRGEQAAILDVLGGRLDTTFCSPVGAKPQVAAGGLRALGMVGDRRSAAMPEVPTFGEQGLEGFDLLIFIAVYAPQGTARPVIERFNAALRAVAAEPEIRARMLEQGQTPVASSADELAAIQLRDAPRWAALIRQAGARVE